MLRVRTVVPEYEGSERAVEPNVRAAMPAHEAGRAHRCAAVPARRSGGEDLGAAVSASVESLRALARALYLGSEVTLAQVARALRVSPKTVQKWSSRDGGWAWQRWQGQRARCERAWAGAGVVPWAPEAFTDPAYAARVARVQKLLAGASVRTAVRRARSRLAAAGFTGAEAAQALFAAAAELVLERDAA